VNPILKPTLASPPRVSTTGALGVPPQKRRHYETCPSAVGSFDHHSVYSRPDASACLSEINTALEEATGFAKNASWVFLTLGTAWGYVHKSSGRLVNQLLICKQGHPIKVH
jgi:hypothetical protein